MINSININNASYLDSIRSRSINLNMVDKTSAVTVPQRRSLLPYATQQVSFGYYFEFKNFKGLPCPCCGKIMSTQSEIIEFTEQAIKSTGKKLADAIDKYKDRLPDTEKSVAIRLIDEAKIHEDLRLDQLLLNISKEPKQKLENTQKEILRKIADLAEGLTGETYKVIQKDIKVINTIITEGRNGDPFKRKKLIQGMQKVLNNESNADNKIILEDILKKSEDMPTSNTDVNAFIVKYSRRKSDEIAHRLIEPSMSTAEHIKPHSKSGSNNPENFLAECKKCNNDRGNVSYVDWLRIHPEMIENTQRYMDEVINRIIDGRIIGYNYYPRAVKKSLKEESSDQLNPDIIKLENWEKEKLHARMAKTGNNLVKSGEKLNTNA